MPTVLDLPEPLVVNLPVDAATVVINTALRHSNWRGITGDVHTGSISATLDESKSWFQDKPWQLSFQVLFRWAAAPGDKSKTLVRMRLTEHNYANLLNLVQEKQKQLLEALREEEQEAIARGPVQPDPEIHPVAAFVSASELFDHGFVAPPHKRRFIIAATTGGDIDVSDPEQEEFISLPPKMSERHVLVCGPTGSGKSSAFFIPNLLLRTQTSAIVTETTAGNEPPDLWNKTAGLRAAAGQKIYYFNPDDLSSWRVNPLDGVITDSDARSVTDLLMRTTTTKGHRTDQFWDTSERMLLSTLILHAVGERDKGNCNLGYVYDLLLKGDVELKDIMHKSRSPDAKRRFESFLNRGTQQTRNIVIAALSQRLGLWSNKKLRALTQTTDIDMSSLPDELFTFYISFPSAKTELRPLAILVWNYILDFVSNADFDHPVMLLLDEFSAFGYLAGMQARLTIIRHKRIGAAFGIQDEQQIKNIYGDEAQIFFSQPATKIFFKPQEMSLALRLRDWLGKTTVAKQSTRSGLVDTRFYERFLQTADELMRMDDTKMLVFFSNTNPGKLSFISHKQYSSQITGYSAKRRQPIDVDENIELTERLEPALSQEMKKEIEEQHKEAATQAQKFADARSVEQKKVDAQQDLEWTQLEKRRRKEEQQRLEEALMEVDDDDLIY